MGYVVLVRQYFIWYRDLDDATGSMQISHVLEDMLRDGIHSTG
jgi:hypothetical protein